MNKDTRLNLIKAKALLRLKHPNKKRLQTKYRRDCMKAIMRLKLKDMNLFID